MGFLSLSFFSLVTISMKFIKQGDLGEMSKCVLLYQKQEREAERKQEGRCGEGLWKSSKSSSRAAPGAQEGSFPWACGKQEGTRPRSQSSLETAGVWSTSSTPVQWWCICQRFQGLVVKSGLQMETKTRGRPIHMLLP